MQRKNDKPKNESASSLTLDIKINTNKMVVSVCGRGLTVKCISAVDVVIEGFITGIDFIT